MRFRSETYLENEDIQDPGTTIAETETETETKHQTDNVQAEEREKKTNVTETID